MNGRRSYHVRTCDLSGPGYYTRPRVGPWRRLARVWAPRAQRAALWAVAIVATVALLAVFHAGAVGADPIPHAVRARYTRTVSTMRARCAGSPVVTITQESDGSWAVFARCQKGS